MGHNGMAPQLHVCSLLSYSLLSVLKPKSIIDCPILTTAIKLYIFLGQPYLETLLTLQVFLLNSTVSLTWTQRSYNSLFESLGVMESGSRNTPSWESDTRVILGGLPVWKVFLSSHLCLSPPQDSTCFLLLTHIWHLVTSSSIFYLDSSKESPNLSNHSKICAFCHTLCLHSVQYLI